MENRFTESRVSCSDGESQRINTEEGQAAEQSGFVTGCASNYCKRTTAVKQMGIVRELLI